MIFEKEHELVRQLAREFAVKGQFELSSRVIGLVGLGAIGKALVSMLKPFGCKIILLRCFQSVRGLRKRKWHRICYI